MNIFDELLSGRQPAGVSPELLETLGKQAAARYLNEGVSLNDSIVKLASEHPQLENEHIKRIVEFANNETFQKMFQDSDDKNVHFPVADPGVVIRDLKDGGSPSHDGKVLNSDKKSSIPSERASGHMSDYRSDPDNVPTSSGFGDLESAFAEHARQDQSSGASGQGEPVSKTASVHTDHSQHANPIDDVYDWNVKLRAAESKLAESHERCDLLLKEAQENLYQLAKREVLSHDGADLPDVIQAVKVASGNDSVAFSIMRPIAERLVKEGAVSKAVMTKTASVGRMLNPDHPIVAAVSGIVKLANESVRSLAALDEIRDGLQQTEEFLRKHVR